MVRQIWTRYGELKSIQYRNLRLEQEISVVDVHSLDTPVEDHKRP
jgi:hypothetical protein